MNQLSARQRTQVISALVEGNSIRSTCRMTGVAKGTVLKLLVDLGSACEKYQFNKLVKLNSKTIQCDEIWSFCYAKADHVPEQMRGQAGIGDVWTFVAIDADSKLVPCWHVGNRDVPAATQFMHDLARRLNGRVQLTTDGHKTYLTTVESVFGEDIDYAILVKLYGVEPETEKRYSPAKCIEAKPAVKIGNPDISKVSTSYVERQNLTMRTNNRRFTRLTNAFSKKLDNLKCSLGLHYMYYNFARIHKSLGCTPAMAAGVADHVWSLEEIIGLMDTKNVS